MSNLLRGDTPVDLDTCDREPIHVPGAVQPHGVLLALSEPDLVVRQVSSNSASMLGHEPADLLGRRLDEVVAGGLASAVHEASSDSSDPAEHFPLSTDVVVRGEVHPVDALLHRTGGVLVVEIEPGAGPLTFDLTYRSTRRAVSRINRAVSPGELYAIAAEEVRRLTGFDRVMVYRFDAEWNGQVVAEDKTDELNSFLGLRYPASDIPAQARALYTRNWLRLITDVGYRPAPLVPVDDPRTGQPLDLSHSTLRSVSPIHIEYLQNMGVSASMSISLLDRGDLWGLITCHHYSGPHRPPYEVRAAVEFHGQALSLRLVESTDRLEVARALEARSRLADLTTAVNDEVRPAAAALTAGPLTVLDLMPCTGVAVGLDGGYASVGEVPEPSVVRAHDAMAEMRGYEVHALDSLPTVMPKMAVTKEFASGALVLRVSSDQFVVWLRPEQVRTVDWGGDPHNKAIAAGEGDEVRLSPRKSFDLWRETVRLRSEPWLLADVELAGALRANLLDALYARTRRLASVAEVLQRSLLPDQLPTPLGWDLHAENSPTAGGDVGGDWYDAVTLPSGHIVCVLGDVAGHGISAAGTMGQLRNGLRAYLVEDESPSRVLARLSRLAGHLMPLALATATVVVVDLETGLARLASAGHPPACHVPPTGPAVLLPVQPWPPLGAVPDLHEPAIEVTVTIEPGASLVLYSDGMVERRTESIDIGLGRLARLASEPAAPKDLCGLLMRECRDPAGDDDATVLVLHRRR